MDWISVRGDIGVDLNDRLLVVGVMEGFNRLGASSRTRQPRRSLGPPRLSRMMRSRARRAAAAISAAAISAPRDRAFRHCLVASLIWFRHLIEQ